MAPLALALLLLAFTGSTSGNWCVCKDGSDTILQKTLDYACGAGGDCNPIKQTGPCFQPNTVRAHCNFAVNSYFQKKAQTPMSCDFAGTATVTASNPSTPGCTYPASASSTTTAGSGGTPTIGTGTTSTPYSTTTTPSGVLGGGIGNGMGPSGVGTNSDDTNNASLLTLLPHTTFLFPFSISIFSYFLIIIII